eukprot:TRINITY_DN8813_c0_g1_i2.p1 TRINITY_DN8813_c0_g1~~TRINITY_DN8813_c0_g1_i2.p1  ORF type:complete len:304 (+),score=50.07 TRINITY_DN8813_c0_g1_i2:159-1070(+)
MSVVFHPDGSKVLSCSCDNSIRMWNLEGTLLNCLLGHTGTVYRAVFQTQNRVISASFDRTVKIWEISEEMIVNAHEARILSTAFSPDGKLLATGSRDKTIKIWDTETGKKVNLFHGHISNVFGLCWSPDGKYLVSASRDYTVRIWNLNRQVDRFYAPKGTIFCSCSWSPSGKTIMATTSTGKVFFFNVRNYHFEEPTISTFPKKEFCCCAYSPSGKYAATSTSDGKVQLWKASDKEGDESNSSKVIAIFHHHQKAVNVVAFSPDAVVRPVLGEDVITLNNRCHWNNNNNSNYRCNLSSTFRIS